MKHCYTSHKATWVLLAGAVWLCWVSIVVVAERSQANLNEPEVREIVRRSFQYVAMYNVIQRAVDRRGLNEREEWAELTDHTANHIARPNNDFVMASAILDVRNDPVILEVPTFDSGYASLEVCGYDHYCNVVLSTRNGDFAKPTRILFYTGRTQNYEGEGVEGVDRIVKLTCDFSVALVRVMPHQNDQERFGNNVKQLKAVNVLTLSEFQNKPARLPDDVKFPRFGKTDADVFGTNLLEVMQFVFNHTTFDIENDIDQSLLAVYEPLGVAPDQKYDREKVARIDGALFRKVAEQVRSEEQAKLGSHGTNARYNERLFRPKGQMDLDALVMQSALGPIGLPVEEAAYPTLPTADGEPLTAKHDYVIRMTKDQLPPARAFWSFTLYDTKNGFLIPNDRKKYSVGHNAGMKLDKDGGIQIVIAAEKPSGVPEENWLPINRGDHQLDIICRVYVPDLGRFRTWQAPKVERMPAP